MKITVGVEDCVVALVGDLQPIAPSFAFCYFLVLLVWRVLVDEILDIFVEDGGHPSRRGRVEFDAFFLLIFEGPDLDFFARNWAVHLICGWLLNRFGGECLLGRRDDGEGEVEIVLRSVVVQARPCFHLLNYYGLRYKISFFNGYSLVGIVNNYSHPEIVSTSLPSKNI